MSHSMSVKSPVVTAFLTTSENCASLFVIGHSSAAAIRSKILSSARSKVLPRCCGAQSGTKASWKLMV